MNLKVWKVFFIATVTGVSVLAQDRMQDLSEEGISASEDSVQARQEATQDAVEKVSAKLIREIIGDTKFDRNLSTIKAKVYPQSERYIPFIKTGEGKRVGSELRLPVQVKVSIPNLETVLQKAGLLSSSEGPSMVLPVVSYLDLVNNRQLKWWIDSPEEMNPFLKSVDRALIDALKAQMGKAGFHTLDPQTWKYRHQVPQNLQMDSLRTQDYLSLAEVFKGNLVLRGEIRFERGTTSQSFKIISKMIVLHAQNGRVVADAIRSVETDAGAFAPVVGKKTADVLGELMQDLAQQVQEAWSRGTFGANLVRLVIHRPLSFSEIENLKENLKSQVKVVKSLSERLFTPDTVEFEVDVSGGGEALGQVLEKLKGYKVTSVSALRVECK